MLSALWGYGPSCPFDLGFGLYWLSGSPFFSRLTDAGYPHFWQLDRHADESGRCAIPLHHARIACRKQQCDKILPGIAYPSGQGQITVECRAGEMERLANRPHLMRPLFV